MAYADPAGLESRFRRIKRHRQTKDHVESLERESSLAALIPRRLAIANHTMGHVGFFQLLLWNIS